MNDFVSADYDFFTNRIGVCASIAHAGSNGCIYITMTVAKAKELQRELKQSIEEAKRNERSED